MRFPLKTALLLGCLTLPLTPALAEDPYTFELGKFYPAAMRAYQTIMPKSYSKMAWVYKLNGTGTPLEQKSVGGTDFLSGTSCKPHECGGNMVALLVTSDGSRAVAEVQLEDSNSEYFGDPTDAEQAALDEMLQ